MRYLTWTTALLTFAALAPTSSVRADMVGTFSNSYGTTGGGEFLFTPVGDYQGLTLDPFLTFCLERNEYLDFSSEFTVVNIGPAAFNGGLGGGNPDPLDERTAWLYQSFRDGSLAAFGYDYSTGTDRVASANALQRVFWGIEQELGDTWTPAEGLEETFYNAAVANANGLGNVRVLNIRWPSGERAQSQLVLIPAPGSMLLGTIGLGVVGCIRRRLR